MVTMSKKLSYPVQIFWSEEDEGFVAIVPDLPGCSAFGDTAEEALRESEDAIAAWIEAASKAGNAIPAPSQLPLQKKYSGKVLLRMPQSLHGKLCRAADEEGISLNQFMVYLLTEGVSTSRRYGIEDACHCRPHPVQVLSKVVEPMVVGNAVFSTTDMFNMAMPPNFRCVDYPGQLQIQTDDYFSKIDCGVPKTHRGATMRRA
jgi:antitoxin HicB